METDVSILACKRSFTRSTSELFRWVRRNYSFVDPRRSLPKERCLVLPYVMTTDGHDVLACVGPQGTVDLGVSFIVRRPKGLLERFRRSPSRFDRIVKEQVLHGFLALFGDARVKRGARGDRQDTKLEASDVQLLSIDKAVRSIDGLQVFPLYFLLFRSCGTAVVSAESLSLVPVPVGMARRDPGLLVKMPYVSRSVACLMADGHIAVPPAREGSFDVGDA